MLSSIASVVSAIPRWPIWRLEVNFQMTKSFKNVKKSLPILQKLDIWQAKKKEPIFWSKIQILLTSSADNETFPLFCGTSKFIFYTSCCLYFSFAYIYAFAFHFHFSFIFYLIGKYPLPPALLGKNMKRGKRKKRKM